MTTSMKDYTARDFNMYYTGAWLLHPLTGEVCKLRGVLDNGNCALTTLAGTNLEPVPYKKLNFNCFMQRLGYRHTNDGAFLYYLTRRAARQAARGLRENTVNIASVPEVTKLYTNAGATLPYRSGASWRGELIEQSFKPSFVSVEDAVKLLRGDNQVVGLALAYSFAMTLLSTNTATPFVILFKGQRAALSADGTTWKPTNNEYVGVLKRGLPSLTLEEV